MRLPTSRTASSITSPWTDLRVVDDNTTVADVDPVAGFLATLRGHTASTYRWTLKSLFDTTGATPATLTVDQLLAWGSDDRYANNTLRTRLAAARSFYTWMERRGYPTQRPCHPDVLKELRRRYPKTYGKVQSKNPARWLTHSEAFTQLLSACRDGSLLGVRDEIILRLGLTGLRKSEIAGLRRRDLDLHRQELRWIGKGRRPRVAAVSPSLLALLTKLLDVGPDLGPDDPILCIIRPTRGPNGRYLPGTQQVLWGHGISPHAVYRIITARAVAAGLGHVAPHDLRRSAAAILHKSVTPDGAHHFDLLDIQKVLGHADPATTMRSYLDPMDTDVLDRAASVLD